MKLHDVSFEVFELCGAIRAIAAGIWAVAGVDTTVSFQISLIRRLITAQLTLEESCFT